MSNNTKDEGAEKAGALSRRKFLATAAIGTGSAVLAGSAVLPGCDSKSSSGSSNDNGSGTDSSFDSLNDSKLNPQDTSYTTYTTDYAALFSPLVMGGITLANRIVKSAAGSETAMLTLLDFKTHLTLDESIERCTAYYGNMAKGGAGLVMFEETCFSKTGNPYDAWWIYDDKYNRAYESVVDAVHSHGSKILVQLVGDFGHMSSSKAAASPLDMNNTALTPMSTSDVQDFIANFVECAQRFQARGFDGVDINAACSHTFDSFLSRFWNTERTDAYGPQSLASRALIVTELIQKIRAACGDDFVIEVLYNGIEENVLTLGDSSLCIKTDEAVAFAKIFEQAGADALQIRSATFGDHSGGFMTDIQHAPEHGHTGLGTILDFSKHLDGMEVGKWDGAAALLEIAEKIKENVSIPVGFVGCADPRLAPDVINNAIRDGKIDFAAMTRPLMADPELPNKLKAGNRDQVAPCNHCLTCWQAVLAVGTPMYCRVNPALARAYTADMPEGWDVQKAVTSKKVMVIGGGPAGMEAARIAAQRGHSVTLYDSGSTLGGKMRWAAAVKGTHEKIADYISYLTRQQEVNGVTVVKGTTVTAAMVKSNAPGAVVVAVGGTRPTLDIPGIGSSIVSSTTSTPTGTRVAVLGLNFQAVDYAIRLVKYGKEVTLISSDSSELEANLDIEHPCWPRYFNKAWLRAKGVQIYGSATVTKITTSGLTLTTSYGTTVDLELDAVVPFPSLVKNSALFEAIKGMGIEVYEVGDCADPGTIAKATASANVTARKI